VGRGREKLLGTGPGVDDQGYEDEDAPERSHDPETLRRDADSYVDAKLGAFEAVLAKTLEAVGKGRHTLQGRVASDELGTLGDGTGAQHTSDADYLAGLAEIGSVPAEPDREIPQAPQIPAQQPVYAQQQDPQQDVYGYQQQPYGQQDPYAVYQQDPYAYQQQDPYAAYQQHQQQGYDQGQAGYAQPQAAHEPAALDETSLFDTSMISTEQLRQYEQGR
jgi:hypothetical protein